MGYQLWTSPITGYRRKGTRLSELRSLIDSGITIRAILEPLQSCPAGAAAAEMATLLGRREFDAAGVQESERTPVIGFVLQESLNSGVVRDHLKPLSAEHLVSEMTTLPSTFSALASRPRVFVLVGQYVKGIATRADLNKPPVRIYLFSLISLLEMHLTFWIRVTYPDDAWNAAISKARLEAAMKIQNDRRAVGQASELIDCIQMGDKRDLLLKQKDLCRSLGLGSRNKAETFLTRAERLRNLLAHGQQNLADGSTWEELFELVAWTEALVGASDTLVEEKAARARRDEQSALWTSV